MVNQLVNYFYTRFLFKIDSLPQDVFFLLYIATNFFKNFNPDIRELLISEGVKVLPRLSTETNHQGKHRLVLFINSAVGAKKNIITITAAVQPEGGSRHPRTLIGMYGGNPSM